MSSVKSDIEIARAAKMKPIQEILDGINVPNEASVYSPMGRYIAKIKPEYLETLKNKKDGKLILVTAITPTPAGEGKTSTSVGLTDGLNKIGKKFKVIGAVTQLGLLGCNVKNWKDKEIRKNSFFCPDKSVIKLWEKYLLGVRKSGSSCGAIIEIRASGIPIGLGAPIYSKLDADIAAALMSINAVKGVNIGSGMYSALLSGLENSDEIRQKGKKTLFKSNNAGGILGGISSGQDIIASFAVKPTSSILLSRKTINKKGKNTEISVKGRHDPCVGIRAVPIGEAMMNCVLLDHYLMNKAQCK